MFALSLINCNSERNFKWGIEVSLTVNENLLDLKV
jgi:hypothetical protein